MIRRIENRRVVMLRLISLVVLFIALATPGYAQTYTIEDWRKQIVTQLASNKRFPPGALGQTGSVKVGFVLDRQGRLVSHWLDESAGNRALDEESLAIVARAQPFPMPPPDLKEDHLRMAVPFIFDIHPEQREYLQSEARLNARMRGICRGC
jgi:periplasmic protein TonB